MPHAAEHTDGTPDAEQNQSVRAGAEAAGGVAPQPGDPDTPADASKRAEREDADMRRRGFGDHKGASID